MPTTFTWSPPLQPYSNTPTIISDGDGSHSMVFSGIHEPSKLPELTQNRHIKVSKTRPWITDGVVHPGYRIIASFGSSDNLKELKMELTFVTPNALAQLQAYSDASPGVFCISINGTGGASTWTPTEAGDVPSGYTPVVYLCMFKDKGLVIGNYDKNQRVFSQVGLDLYILNKTTSVTFS